MKAFFLLAAAVLAASSAPGQTKSGAAKPKPAASSPATAPLDKAALERYLRRVELWPSQVQIAIGDPVPFIAGLDKVNVHLSAGQAVKDVLYFVSSDRKTILRGEGFRLDQDPFQSNLDLLKLEHQPSFGPDHAAATLVVVSDFQCPLCAQEARELRARAPAEFGADLRVVFVDFPLDAIHPWARLASIGGRCVYRQNGAAFWDYHDWVFDHQSEITLDNLKSKVAEWAKPRRLDAAQLAQCLETRATEVEVERAVAVAKKLGVDSTPTNFLNGRRMVGHVPWQNLSQIVKMELEFKKRK